MREKDKRLMTARTTELIVTRSKLGDSLRQISLLTGLTIEQVKETHGQATGLTAEELSTFFHIKQRGHSLEQISQAVEVAHDVLVHFLPQDTPDTEHDQTYVPRHFLPQFVYSSIFGTGQMLRTNLLTGELSCLTTLGFRYKQFPRWRELPGGRLLITGGWNRSFAVREVVKVDTLREWAVCTQPPMHTARFNHAAVYHSQCLYVLGGWDSSVLSECERYLCAETRWEVLPALPEGGSAMSAVVLDISIYALGGFGHPTRLDTVQKLSLDSLTWELMQLKLPHSAYHFPCLTTDSGVYLVIKGSLFSFTPFQVKLIKTLPQADYKSDMSYYSRGTLYCTYNSSFRSFKLGSY
jgi:hypothetical protein